MYLNLEFKNKSPYFDIRKMMIDVLDNSIAQNKLLNEYSWKSLANAVSCHSDGHSGPSVIGTPTRVCG
jgi:hypothetical protein